jgi:phytoene dehydrogenase-like protein
LGGEAAEVVAAEADVARGRVPERPYVLMAQPGRFDVSRRAGSVEPVWAYTHLPRALAASGRAVDDAVHAMLSQLERHAPGLRDRTVSRQVFGPGALAAGNSNLVGGDIAGGAPTLLQLVARPRWTRFPYDLPLPGAFIASASTPPGPGVHGMAGFHAAARLAKTRFGIDLDHAEPTAHAGGVA